jgi:hypothetical protein
MSKNTKMTNRNLLIRIDERVKTIQKDVAEIKTDVKNHNEQITRNNLLLFSVFVLVV